MPFNPRRWKSRRVANGLDKGLEAERRTSRMRAGSLDRRKDRGQEERGISHRGMMTFCMIQGL